MKKMILCCCIFLFFIYGCVTTKLTGKDPLTPVKDICMQPLYSGYIPVVQEGDPVGIIPTVPVDGELVPSGWKRVRLLPGDLGNKFELLFIKERLSEKEFYILSRDFEETTLFVVHPNFTETFSFSEVTKIINNSEKVYAISADNESKEILVLKFEENFRKFIMLAKNTHFRTSIIYDVEMTHDDQLWFVLQAPDGKGAPQLYSYDLKTNTYQKIEFEDGWIQEIDLDIYDNLFVVAVHANTNMDNTVMRYDNGQFHWNATYNTPMPGEIADLTHLFISEDNQLWLSDALWFPKAGYTSDKRIILRSPIFINPNADIRRPVTWESPEPQAITEDGRVWFKSKRGLAWHQPETGEWCMFTTADSNIVKDDEGNLWIIYDNALYMLPAEETKAKG